MNVKWRLARLRTMSGREIAFRAARAVKARVESVGIGWARPPSPSGECGLPWIDSLPRAFDATPYTLAADQILSGRFDVFSMRAVALGFPPRWNVDPKTGTAAPLVFGKNLDYRAPQVVGDIKHLWEINRHHELVTLAQAWHLSGDTRYLHACRSLLDSWFEQCPYPLGANWCSSLEHAFRLVNWSFAWHLLGADASPLWHGPEGAAFRIRWLNSIYQHCHFIAGHLSRHSSANNHLIGEATGLFIASTTWPLWNVARGWQTRSHVELEREACEQNFADGVNKEQALWYHQAVAEMLLLAGLVARANACDFSPAYWQRLEAMLEFVASIMDAGGHVPAFGDADDAVLARLDPGAPEVFRSLLASGALLFERPEFKRKAGALDAKTHWLFGDAAVTRFAQLDGTARTLPIRRDFAEGGYYVLGNDFETSREVRVVADAGPLGYLSIAAHGHADALSFTLSAGGTEILVDPGTFTYSAGRWRDYFRGTAAHNTVRIDGCDQSVSGGTFLWLRHARAQLERFEVTQTQDRLVAYHDGYGRLADPVRHRRLWCFDRPASTLTIVDELVCKGRHQAEWFWHFAPGCEVGLSGNRLTAQCGEATLTMRFASALECRLVAGSAHAPLGWHSRAMDEKVPTVTAVMSTTLAGEQRFQIDAELAFGARDLA